MQAGELPAPALPAARHDLIAQMGIEDRSPLEMLRAKGIDLADLAVVDAWVASQRQDR